jgi:hypothetical protein
VGFCFSFPVEQTGISSGTMIKLTKKLANEGLVGCDPVQMLQKAIDRLHAPVTSHRIALHRIASHRTSAKPGRCSMLVPYADSSDALCIPSIHACSQTRLRAPCKALIQAQVCRGWCCAA